MATSHTQDGNTTPLCNFFGYCSSFVFHIVFSPVTRRCRENMKRNLPIQWKGVRKLNLMLMKMFIPKSWSVNVRWSVLYEPLAARYGIMPPTLKRAGHAKRIQLDPNDTVCLHPLDAVCYINHQVWDDSQEGSQYKLYAGPVASF